MEISDNIPTLTAADLQAQGIRILWSGQSNNLNAHMSLALIDSVSNLLTFGCTLFALNKKTELCSFVFDLTHEQVIDYMAAGTLVTEVESLALEALTAVSEKELMHRKETNSVAIH